MNKRNASNKLKQRQLETKYLEEQTKKMEDKLSELKKQVEEQRQLKATTNFQSTLTRWKKSTRTDAPLKNYAKQVLQEQKQAFKKFGIDEKKITGTKTFTSIKKRIKEEKQQQEDKNPKKISSMMSKTNESLKSQEKQSIQIQNKPVEIIQNNFFKAKIDAKNLVKEKTVLEFLEEIFLQQYYPLFQENNITQLSDLRFLSQEQLQDFSIPKGHQIKILKKIREEFDKNKSPSKMTILIDKQENWSNPAGKVLVQMGYGDGDVNEYENIQSLQKQGKKLEENFEQADSENVSQEEQNDVVLITVPLSQIALQTGDPQQNEDNEDLASNCFNCYKSIPWKNDKIQSPDGRNFCSPTCMKVYKMQMQVTFFQEKKTCPACGNEFFKANGFYETGLWFCSIRCCPNKDQIEEMFLDWTIKDRKHH